MIWRRYLLEVQRAIQRSIKGVEYFSTSGPTVGPTPRDLVRSRGTMSLYHYRPLAEEVYRVPVLIVMATTKRGYEARNFAQQGNTVFISDMYGDAKTDDNPKDAGARSGSVMKNPTVMEQRFTQRGTNSPSKPRSIPGGSAPLATASVMR